MVLSVTDYVATHSCVIVTPLQPEIGVRSGREAKSRRAARRHNTPHTTQHHKLSFARLATTRSVQAGVLAAPILHAHAHIACACACSCTPPKRRCGERPRYGAAPPVHAGLLAPLLLLHKDHRSSDGEPAITNARRHRVPRRQKANGFEPERWSDLGHRAANEG